MGMNQMRYDRWEAMEAAARWDAEHPNDDDGFDKLRDAGAFDNDRYRDWTFKKERRDLAIKRFLYGDQEGEA